MSSLVKRKITVLALVHSLPPFKTGGAESQALKLSKHLKAKDVETILVTIGSVRLKGWDDLEGVPVYRVYNLWDQTKEIAKRLLRQSRLSLHQKVPDTQIEYDDEKEITTKVITPISFSTRLRYISFFISCFVIFFKKKSEIDIIYVPSLEWSVFAGMWLSKLFKRPLVVKDSTMNGITNILRYPGGRRKQRHLIKLANFVAISKAIILNLKKAGVKDSKINYIPNGIEVEKLYSQPDCRADKITKFLFIGNLTQQPAKGVDILLKSWKIVTDTRENVHLDIVGDGDIDSYNSYAREAEISKTVTFHGKQDVRRFLSEACFFVLPSRREGLSNALMEAMLHGLPCIATDISGSQDLIINQKNGILVPSANVESLTEAIVYMIDHREEAKVMGLNARQTILENCDFDRVSDLYGKLYNELLLKSS